MTDDQELTPANENPWYVLMTSWGEQDGVEIDWDLHEKNKDTWNRFWIDENDTDWEWAQAARPNPMKPLTPKDKADLEYRFEQRGATLPKDTENIRIDIRDVAFPAHLICQGFVFPRTTWFEGVEFQGYANFDAAEFEGYADFPRAEFQGKAFFQQTAFQGYVDFEGAEFQGGVTFQEASFNGKADFQEVEFQGYATFQKALFQDNAYFQEAEFQAFAEFPEAEFQGDASFIGTGFGLGADFSGAAFKNSEDKPSILEIATHEQSKTAEENGEHQTEHSSSEQNPSREMAEASLRGKASDGVRPSTEIRIIRGHIAAAQTMFGALAAQFPNDAADEDIDLLRDLFASVERLHGMIELLAPDAFEKSLNDMSELSEEVKKSSPLWKQAYTTFVLSAAAGVGGAAATGLISSKTFAAGYIAGMLHDKLNAGDPPCML